MFIIVKIVCEYFYSQTIKCVISKVRRVRKLVTLWRFLKNKHINLILYLYYLYMKSKIKKVSKRFLNTIL